MKSLGFKGTNVSKIVFVSKIVDIDTLKILKEEFKLAISVVWYETKNKIFVSFDGFSGSITRLNFYLFFYFVLYFYICSKFNKLVGSCSMKANLTGLLFEECENVKILFQLKNIVLISLFIN